jgi:phage gp16-like protein
MKNIPGTEFPLKVYARKGPPALKDADAGKRQKLLAIVHIAKKELCLKPDEYEMILRSFKVASSGDMTLTQLDNMIAYMKHLGWKARKKPGARSQNSGEQIKKLRERVTAEAAEMGLAENRLAGLIKKICGVDKLEWCTDPGKLRRLLKVMGNIKVSGDRSLKIEDGKREKP